MKKEHFVFLVFTLCFFALGAGLVKGQTPEEVLNKAKEITTLPKYQADFRLWGSSFPNATTQGIHYGRLGPDGSVQQRMKNTITAGIMKIPSDNLVLGSNVFAVFADQKRAIKAPEEKKSEPFLTDSAYFALTMREEKLDRGKCYVLVSTFTEESQRMQEEAAKNLKGKHWIVAREEKWVDAKTFIILQVLRYDQQGNVIAGIRYSNIKTDINLPDSLFALPADFTIVDAGNSSDFSMEQEKHARKEAQLVKPRTSRWMVFGVLALPSLGLLIWGVQKMKRRA